MLAIATREQRTLTGLEETRYHRHLAECDACRALETETAEDWQWVARIPNDAFSDPNVLVLPVVDPAVFDAQREIASGGMGRITRATDRRLGREVAIKEVLDPQMRARFEREAMITARLQHPAIIPIYEAGMWPNGSAFYTMRLVNGGTLADSIANATTMAERIALLGHVVAVTEALAYAHSRKIIHRDLKPGNVLVGSFGETVVIDWGLAKELGHAIDDATQLPSLLPSSQNLTRAGVVLGTPGFMSPEQAGGEELDERADVYALGSILYNLLAGVAPYHDKHPDDTPDLLVELARLKPPTPIGELAPDAPEDLRAIVERAMGPMATRYASANEMAEELRRFQTGKLISSREYRLQDLLVRWLRKHRTAVVVAFVAFVALASVAIVAVVNITRARASERAQRVAAEASLLMALEEQARTELLVGDAERGVVYASEAYRRGRDTPALRYLLAVATRNLTLAHDTIGPPQLSTTCGTDPNCFGTDIMSLGFAADGRLALVEATGGISLWRDGRRTSYIALDRKVGSAQLDPAVERAAIGGEHSLEMWDIQRGTKQWSVDDKALSTPHIEFAPSGKQLVAWPGEDEIHTALVLDVATGAVVATIDVGAQRVVDAAFSPDGRSLAACGADGTVRVWETAQFTTLATWRGAKPHALEFAGPDRIVVDDEVWRIGNASRLHVLRGHAGARLTIAATVSGDLIATADDHAVRLWNRNGELLAESKVVGGKMRYLLFAPDGVLVGVGNDPHIYVWELPSLELRHAIAAHDGPADLVTLDRTGSRIATSGMSDQLVREWAMPVGSQIVHVPGLAAVFATGGQWIAAVAAGTTIRRQASGAAVGQLELGFAHMPQSIEASRDGRRILLDEGDRASVVDLATGAPIMQLSSGWITKLSDDGRYVLDASEGDALHDALVRVLDATTGRAVLELKFPYPRTPSTGDISPDGQRITLGFGNRIKQWQVATGTPLATVTVAGPRDDYQPRFDPTGKTFVVTGFYSKLVIVYDVATGLEISRFEDTARVSSVRFDREGGRLLTWNDSNVVHLWDTRRKMKLASVPDVSNAYAFSVDGDRFATGAGDGTVRIWDTATGRQLATFRGHQQAITQVSFNDANDRLLVVSKDEHASLWDVHLERRGPAEIAALAEHAAWTLVGGVLVAKQAR